MRTPKVVLVVLVLFASAIIAALLGLLTSGVQATAEPRGLPVAVAVPEGVPPLQQAAQRITGQGGGQVSWRVTSPQEGRQLLEDKQVYGVLEFAPSAQGMAVNVVVSGAVNPSGTQVAQQVLTNAGQAVAVALAQANSGTPVQPVSVQVVHPASPAARAVPLAASSLLWIGCLVGSVLVVAVSHRAQRRAGAGLRLVTAVVSALGATGALLGLMWLWDPNLRMDAPVIGFLLLVAFAFAAVQGAVLRLLGLAGMAILAPLFLVAPAVAGQVPELLHPAYRTLLWSWTPFRFSTEGVRSLLLLDGMPSDLRLALIVLGGMAVVGLIVLLWPGRRRSSRPDADEAAASKPLPTAAGAV
jgi:hypothetical protein